MFCSTGEVIFIHSDQLLWYIRGDIKSIYPELALYGSKNKCAWTATVFFPISQVCARGATLKVNDLKRREREKALEYKVISLEKCIVKLED